MTVGVLALQGGFEAHAKALTELGAEVREVRTPEDLDGLDALKAEYERNRPEPSRVLYGWVRAREDAASR